jgi:hypothetical protein
VPQFQDRRHHGIGLLEFLTLPHALLRSVARVSRGRHG